MQARCISQQSLCVLYAILASPFENDRFAKKTTARNGKAIHGDGQAGTATGAPAPAGNWIDLRLRRCGVGKND
jgi:hypothetical protein